MVSGWSSEGVGGWRKIRWFVLILLDFLLVEVVAGSFVLFSVEDLEWDHDSSEEPSDSVFESQDGTLWLGTTQFGEQSVSRNTR
jgi:hypothetical protein